MEDGGVGMRIWSLDPKVEATATERSGAHGRHQPWNFTELHTTNSNLTKNSPSLSQNQAEFHQFLYHSNGRHKSQGGAPSIPSQLGRYGLHPNPLTCNQYSPSV